MGKPFRKTFSTFSRELEHRFQQQPTQLAGPFACIPNPNLWFNRLIPLYSLTRGWLLCFFQSSQLVPSFDAVNWSPPFALILDSVFDAGWRSRSEWVGGTLEGSQALELLAALTPLTSSRLVFSSQVHLTKLLPQVQLQTKKDGNIGAVAQAKIIIRCESHSFHPPPKFGSRSKSLFSELPTFVAGPRASWLSTTDSLHPWSDSSPTPLPDLQYTRWDSGKKPTLNVIWCNGIFRLLNSRYLQMGSRYHSPGWIFDTDFHFVSF